MWCVLVIFIVFYFFNMAVLTFSTLKVKLNNNFLTYISFFYNISVKIYFISGNMFLRVFS